MANDKTYYQTLGVTPDAEDIVIRAAYKALSQRYHPDKFKGSAEEAEAKMKEINIAYSVLSDKEKRKAYDEELKAKGKNREYYEDSDAYADSEDGKNNGQQTEKTEVDEEWAFACEYYPELTNAYKSLRKISHELANCFKLWLLTSKDFDQMEELSRSMKQSFMELHFGTDPEIIKFAEKYIRGGRKDVLRELNRAVLVFGSKIDSDIIINKLLVKFNLKKKKSKISGFAKLAEEFSENPSFELASQVVLLCGGTINNQGLIFTDNDTYKVKVDEETRIVKADGLITVARELVEKYYN